MKIGVKQPGKKLKLIECSCQYRGDGITSILGQNIDQCPVWLDSEHTLAFVCDGYAPYRKTATNFFIEVPNPFAPVQNIMGDVVFVRTKPCDPTVEEIWDYEIVDLQETDIRFIEYLLSDGKQVSLAMEYFTRGGC